MFLFVFLSSLPTYGTPLIITCQYSVALSLAINSSPVQPPMMTTVVSAAVAGVAIGMAVAQNTSLEVGPGRAVSALAGARSRLLGWALLHRLLCSSRHPRPKWWAGLTALLPRDLTSAAMP